MKAAVGVLNLKVRDNTISTIRTAEHFGFRRVFVIGKELTCEKQCINCHRNMIIKYFDSEIEFVNYIKKEGYKLVLFEKSVQSVNIAHYKFPDDVCLMTGHESEGFSDYMLREADSVVHIPNIGLVRCMNTAAAFAIGVYKYFEQRVIL